MVNIVPLLILYVLFYILHCTKHFSKYCFLFNVACDHKLLYPKLFSYTVILVSSEYYICLLCCIRCFLGYLTYIGNNLALFPADSLTKFFFHSFSVVDYSCKTSKELIKLMRGFHLLRFFNLTCHSIFSLIAMKRLNFIMSKNEHFHNFYISNQWYL